MHDGTKHGRSRRATCWRPALRKRPRESGLRARPDSGSSAGLFAMRRCPRTALILQSATLQLGWPTRPVLKHGPRSLTCARVVGSDTLRETHRRNESEGCLLGAEGGRSLFPRGDGSCTPGASDSSSRGKAHRERARWDPKDGELCLARTKSGETLMEVRSDSDVQIDRRSWV